MSKYLQQVRGFHRGVLGTRFSAATSGDTTLGSRSGTTAGGISCAGESAATLNTRGAGSGGQQFVQVRAAASCARYLFIAAQYELFRNTAAGSTQKLEDGHTEFLLSFQLGMGPSVSTFKVQFIRGMKVRYKGESGAFGSSTFPHRISPFPRHRKANR
jgi:hypothetical protein